jgi:putative nucleotidyltransferase with HDIG domain
MMESNHRLQKVINFVEQAKDATLKKKPERAASLEYRWKHTLRVTQYGKKLAELEGADIELCMVACLLHDIAKIGMDEHGLDHGRIGARFARPFLQELGYSKDDVENMCFAIAMHVDGKVDFEHPVTSEAKVVSDADNIDRYGAYRVLLEFRKQLDDYEALIEHAEKRIQKLKSYRQKYMMETESGEKLFKRHIDLQINFIEHLIADGQLTVIPEL